MKGCCELVTIQNTSHKTLFFTTYIYFLNAYLVQTHCLALIKKTRLFLEVNCRENKLGKLVKNRQNVQNQSKFSKVLNAGRFYEIGERITTESMYFKNQYAIARPSSDINITVVVGEATFIFVDLLLNKKYLKHLISC